MLLPQFSLRTILLATTACTVLFLIARQAFQGEAWAVGVTIAVLSVPACLVVYALFYGLTLLVSRVVGVQRLPARTSQGGVQLGPDEHLPPSGAGPDNSTGTVRS